MKLGAATVAQILTGHELGHSCSEIAEQLELDLNQVEACLMQNCPSYRSDKKTTGTPALSGELNLEVILNEYRILAQFGESEMVRERALRNLINELKGRNDLEERALRLKERQLEKGGSQDERIKKFNQLVVLQIGGSVDKGQTIALPIKHLKEASGD